MVQTRVVLPRPVVPEGDITGPTCRGLVFPEGTLHAQVPNEATDGLAPSLSGSLLAAV